MNKILLLGCFLLNSLLWGQNITAEVTYAFGTDNNLITKSSELKIFKDIDFKLKCTATKSRFELIKKMTSDATRSNRRYVSGADAWGIFYKNVVTKENVRVNRFMGKVFTVSKPYKERYHWKLTKETKMIGGYLCYKAIHTDSTKFEGRKISLNTVAYYAPEIPLPFGPINIHGLPGLVLEAQSRSFYYIAKTISISKNKKIKIERPSIGEEVTYKEFMDYIRKNSPYTDEERKKMMKKLKEKIKKE